MAKNTASQPPATGPVAPLPPDPLEATALTGAPEGTETAPTPEAVAAPDAGAASEAPDTAAAPEAATAPEAPAAPQPEGEPGLLRYRVNWRFEGFRAEPLMDGDEVLATEEEAALYLNGVLTALAPDA